MKYLVIELTELEAHALYVAAGGHPEKNGDLDKFEGEEVKPAVNALNRALGKLRTVYKEIKHG